MATAAVCVVTVFKKCMLTVPQSPPLYLRVTSTSKEGLDKATKMIDEMMTQDLPNLVDERRFRRREPETFERDEFGRVRTLIPAQLFHYTDMSSANGPRRRFPSVSNQSVGSIFVPRLLDGEVTTSSTSSKKQVARSKSKAVDQASWNQTAAKRARSLCTCISRGPARKASPVRKNL